MFKKICAFLLQLAIIGSCFFTAQAETTKETVKNEKSNGNLSISIDEETCYITVTDNTTGAVWVSNPSDPQVDEYTTNSIVNDLKSQIIVTYYDTDNKRAVIGSHISSVKRKTFKITKSENKIRVDYDFSRKNEKFIIPVEYSVEGGSFRTTVLVNEIKEYGDVKVGEIALLPYFFHALSSDEGYIFIPDGSGALVDLSLLTKALPAYKQRVYGRDLALAFYFQEGNMKDIMLPVFGMRKNGTTAYAIVNGNEAAANINAECAGTTSTYSRAYASFTYRVFDTVTIAGSDWRQKNYITAAKNVEKVDFSVEYRFIGNGEYTDIAANYREHLKNNGVLSKKISNEEKLTAALKAYGTTEIRDSFLGIPYTKTVVATSFEDISNMLTELNSDKSKNIAVFLQDFDKNTRSGKYPNSTKWMSQVGGKKGYASLLNEFGETTRFFRTTDLIYGKSQGLDWFNQSGFAKMASNDLIQRTEYSPVTYELLKTKAYALNNSNLLKKTNKVFKKSANVKDRVGLALEDFANNVYSDYNEKRFVSRTEMQDVFKKVASNAVDKKLDIALEGANQYLLGVTDIHYNVPVSSSNLIISSKSVPFFQLVVHGYANLTTEPINLESDSEKLFLQSMEYGMVPCFAVTGVSNSTLRRTAYKNLFNTCFKDISNDLKVKFEKSAELIDKIYNSTIVSNTNNGTLGVTKYENGITVVVNYSESSVNYNGTEITALDFEIIG